MRREACPEYVPLLARAGDGSIAQADLERLERHAASCKACQAALATQQIVHRALSVRPRAEANAAFAARVMRAIGPEARAPRWERFDYRRWTWRLAPVTAALAVAAFTWAANGAAGSGTPTAPAALVTSGAAESVAVTALSTDEATPGQVVSLMLFADPDAPLADALQEISQ